MVLLHDAGRFTIYVPDDQLDAYAAALAQANGAAEHLRPSGKNAIVPEKENTEDWFAFNSSTGTITGYKEYHAWVEFPESIGGVPVKAIGAGAFRGDYTLYGMVLPEGLETIGARAFQYDYESILNLPTTLKTIGDSAFEGSLCQELYLGGQVERIGARAFAGTSLGYMAFDFYAPIAIATDAFVETGISDLDLPWDSPMENREAYAALLGEQCPNCIVWINNPGSDVAQMPTNELAITTIKDGAWTAYNGDQPDLTVWTDYDGIDITALGDGVFKGNQTIRSFYPHHCGWFTTIGSEYAFLNEDGSAAFALASCITDRAQMPTVDALLAAVKSDPLPAPTPEPTPAQPVGAEGEPYLGTWHGVSMEMEGSTITFAALGMTMTLTFNDDGTMVMSDGEESERYTWTVEDGAAVIDTIRASMLEDGTLCLEQEGAKMIFSRGEAGKSEPTPASEPAASSGGAPAQDRLERKYVCVNAEVSGFTMDASLLGGEYSLTFHADNTVDFVLAGTTLPSLPWTKGTAETDNGTAEAFIVDYYGTSMVAVCTEAGFDMNYLNAMLIHFVPAE